MIRPYAVIVQADSPCIKGEIVELNKPSGTMICRAIAKSLRVML